MNYNLKDENVAVTFTGGVESTVLAYEIASSKPKSLTLLFCAYKQANTYKSLELLERTASNLRQLCPIFKKVVHTSFDAATSMPGLFMDGFVPYEQSPDTIDYRKQEKTYSYAFVEGRNAILFMHMLAYCASNDISVLYAGHQYERSEWKNVDSYRHRTEDFSPMFVDRCNLMAEVGFSKLVRVEAPFVTRRLSKEDVMLLGMQEYSIDIKKDTYSCQFWPECHKCDNCVQRATALKNLQHVLHPKDMK